MTAAEFDRITANFGLEDIAVVVAAAEMAVTASSPRYRGRLATGE